MSVGLQKQGGAATIPIYRKHGFTIVELLIVVVVIAILATVTIVAYNGISQRAKDSAAQNAASQAYKKAATYAVLNNGSYPVDKNEFLSYGQLTEGSGTTYQYTQGFGGTTYCLTATANSVSYFTTQANSTPSLGVCPGHSADGAVVTNLVNNPSLETASTGWTSSSSSLNPTRTQVSGKWVFRGVRTDTVAVALRASYGLPSTVTVGNTYTASAVVYSSVATSLTLALRQAGTTTNIFSTVHTFAAGETKRISTSGVSTQGSVYVALFSGSGAIGDTYTIDEVMLTEGSTIYNYGDGDSAGWAWLGAPSISTSVGPLL